MSVEAGRELVAARPASWTDAPAAGEGAGTDRHAQGSDDNVALAVDSPARDRALALARSWSLRGAALLAGLALWYWAAKVHLDFYFRFDNVPTPLAVAEALWRHAHEAKFYLHIAVSMRRIALGYSLAAVTGIFLGLLMGRLQTVRDLLMPYIELLRPIPAVAWIPLAILMWPTEESSIIYIVFLGALFPIVLNTIHGVEQTPEVLVRAAESLGASRVQIFWHVVLPAALPSIAAGLSVGMGVAWFSLLAGEIISGQYGIGYFTWNAYSLIQYPDIIVGMLLIGVFGTLSTYGVQLLMRPLLAWQRRTR
ncbi:MAG TPA: ABC transporter permease [Stellaceae bacterium]|nr:ABC transporter permease [Stellaceae bacterium]